MQTTSISKNCMWQPQMVHGYKPWRLQGFLFLL